MRGSKPSRLRALGVATVLSFFFMGLYNGQILKEVFFIVLYVMSITLIFAGIGLITTPILWIIGMVDAHKSAQKISMEITGQAPPAKAKLPNKATREVAPPQEAGQGSGGIKRVAAHIHEAPDEKSPILAWLNQRDMLILLGTRGRWCEVVTADGKRGWINMPSAARG